VVTGAPDEKRAGQARSRAGRARPRMTKEQFAAAIAREQG
jgi:hypothetical protein